MPFLILTTKITSIPSWPHGYDRSKGMPCHGYDLGRKSTAYHEYAAIAKGLPVKAMWQIANAFGIVKRAFYCS